MAGKFIADSASASKSPKTKKSEEALKKRTHKPGERGIG
jgi:hypothetical protein